MPPPTAELHTFLFASLDSKKPETARKVHIRRLYDLLFISIQKHDLVRAKRAWAILARCKEVQWRSLWTTGLHVLRGGLGADEYTTQSLDYLRSMMLQNMEQREMILKEMTFRLVVGGRCKQALDELELYLPSFPFQDDPVLRIYSGMICLYLSSSSLHNENVSVDHSMIREAQSYFNQANALDPENIMSANFLAKLPDGQQNQNAAAFMESDEEGNLVEPNQKRMRT